MTVQQVHLAGRKLGGEQDDPAGPGVVLVDDVPDDQAFLVRLDHYLRGDVPGVSYLHGSPHFLYPRRIGEKTPRSAPETSSTRLFGVLERCRDRPLSP